MASRPTVRLAAVLLVLGVAVSTVPALPMPSVMEVRAGWKSRARQSASIASARAAADPKEQSYPANSDEGYYEEKEVCLQEVSRRDCSTQQYDFCNTGTGNCTTPGTCNTAGCGNPHAQWTSDVACCQHHEGYGGGYGYGHGSASVGDHLWGPHASIGSCDWTTDYVPRVEVTSNINKWGSASAICYFGADSSDCGGPFCDRMVVTLEGAVYYVESVYSYYTATGTNIDECTTTPILPSFSGFFPGTPVRDVPDQARAPDAVPFKPVAKAASGDAGASIQYSHYEGGDHHTNNVYRGNAWVINGAVTAMVGPKKDHWENGLFEYVIQFTTPVGAQPVSDIAASIPWIRDKTYKFTFYKSQGYY